MNFLKRIPFYPLFFAANPVLALLATNIVEVDIPVIYRPLLLTTFFSILILFITRLFLGNLQKAALVTTILMILFFTYGHVYQLLESKDILGMNIGRHRYLVPFYVGVGGLGIAFVLLKVKDYFTVTQVMNVVGAFLLIFPIVQIISFNIRISIGNAAFSGLEETINSSDLQPPGDLPDIYYIVLDTYTRADALQRDFHFDNSTFLNELRELGFYVADCSRSNYSYTQATLAAALNMEYLPDLRDDLEELSLGMGDIWILIKQSLVRRKLEEVGYKTVAFDTGYEWSQIRDADYYFGVGSNPFSLKAVTPFEALLLKSTAVLLLTDSQSLFFKERFEGVNFPHAEFVQRQLFILDRLIEIPAIDQPTFTFAHMLIPHGPYVFDPDGNIREDTGYFGGKLAEPINEQYLLEGYTGEIQFINSRMIEIVSELIETSRIPPIIIIHGDHGLRDENRLQILNVYFLPDAGRDSLYPSISPVNSFRVVFDTTFGTDYGLLVDESFMGDDFAKPLPEYSPQCQELQGRTSD
jgi:hypothetical protein